MTAIGIYNLPKASAISTLLVIPAFVVFLIYRKMMTKTPLFSKRGNGSRYRKSRLPS